MKSSNWHLVPAKLMLMLGILCTAVWASKEKQAVVIMASEAGIM